MIKHGLKNQSNLSLKWNHISLPLFQVPKCHGFYLMVSTGIVIIASFSIYIYKTEESIFKMTHLDY